MIENKTINRNLFFSVIAGLFSLLVANFVFAVEGDTQITPNTQGVGAGQEFSVEIHADTGGKNVGAFNFYLDFDPSLITIDTAQGSAGLDKGADSSSYTVMANADDIANGHYRFGGMTASGFANGSDVHLATIHMKTTTGFSSGSATLSLRINELSTDLGQALATGTATGASVNFVSNDTTPPTISGGQPTGVQLPGTSTVTLSVITSERATCKYSLTSNTDYDSMSYTFSTTGSTEHSQSITGLAGGGAYDYYIRCVDAVGNKNTTDYQISFTVSGQTFGISDFSQLVSDWLQAGSSNTDINSDGVVNTRDLGIMMTSWGQ